MKNLFTYALLAPMYVLTALYAWWFFESKLGDPIVISNVTISEEGPVHDGDKLHVTYTVERRRACLMNTNRLLLNMDTRAEYLLESITRRIVPEEPHTVSYAVRVPSRLVTGTYQLVSKLSLECNPLEHWFPKEYVVFGPKIRVVSGPDMLHGVQ